LFPRERQIISQQIYRSQREISKQEGTLSHDQSLPFLILSCVQTESISLSSNATHSLLCRPYGGIGVEATPTAMPGGMEADRRPRRRRMAAWRHTASPRPGAARRRTARPRRGATSGTCVKHSVEASATVVFTHVEAVMATMAPKNSASNQMCSGGVFSSVVRFRCYPVFDSGRIEVLGVRIPCSRDFVWI
jgi:hypothetical protein